MSDFILIFFFSRLPYKLKQVLLWQSLPSCPLVQHHLDCQSAPEGPVKGRDAGVRQSKVGNNGDKSLSQLYLAYWSQTVRMFGGQNLPVHHLVSAHRLCYKPLNSQSTLSCWTQEARFIRSSVKFVQCLIQTKLSFSQLGHAVVKLTQTFSIYNSCQDNRLRNPSCLTRTVSMTPSARE